VIRKSLSNAISNDQLEEEIESKETEIVADTIGNVDYPEVEETTSIELDAPNGVESQW